MDCLAEIYPRISKDVWSILAGMPADELYTHHFGLGLYLRNNVLTPESELYKLFAREGIDHKDDMSSKMVKRWHESLSCWPEIDPTGQGQINNHIWRATRMKTTGAIRKIDELGRIVLPVEVRGLFALKERDAVEIFTDEGGIYLKPIDISHCIFCAERNELISYGGGYLCRTCLTKINERVAEK